MITCFITGLKADTHFLNTEVAISVAPTETVAVVPAVTRISGLGIGISRLPGKVTVFTTSEASISFSHTLL